MVGKLSAGLDVRGIAQPRSGRSQSIPELGALPTRVRSLYEHSFGTSIGTLFFVAMPFALLALVCVLFIEEVPLRTTLDRAEIDRDDAAAAALDTGGVR